MNPYIKNPENLPEIIGMRQIRQKQFDRGGASRRLVVSQAIVHCPLDYQQAYGGANLEDVDLVPKIVGNNINTKTWYSLELLNGVNGIRYTSKQRGTVEIAYTHGDGQAFRLVTPRFESDGHIQRIWWDGVRTDFNLGLEIRSGMIKFIKRIGSASSPVAIRSVVSGVSKASPIRLINQKVNVLTKSRSYDNFDKLNVRKKRVAEITDQVTDLGGGEFEVMNTFTGRTSTIGNPATREREWKVGEAVYPVWINQDITEDIVGTGDDGESFSGNWYSTVLSWNGTATTVDIPGVRFQTIPDIASGDTIDAGTQLELTVNESSINNGNWYGNDVDDAAAWGAGNLPVNITRTTATVNLAPSATQTYNLNVVAIVQEIVNRGGWAANNDMAFAAAPMGAGGDPCTFDDYTGGTTPAQLEINFTAAGGAASPTSHLLGALYGPMGGPI